MQFRGTRLAMQPDIQLFDVFHLRKVVQAQSEPAEPTASTGFQRHRRCCHEARKFADALAPLDQPVLPTGALTAPRTPVGGDGEVVPAQLLFRHPGAVVLDDDGLSAHRLRECDGYHFCVGIPGVVNELLQRPLGRGILLAQQGGEAGIHLETQMRTSHTESSLKAILLIAIPTQHSSASRNHAAIAPPSNPANPSRVGPSCRCSADQSPWQSAGH